MLIPATESQTISTMLDDDKKLAYVYESVMVRKMVRTCINAYIHTHLRIYERHLQPISVTTARVSGPLGDHSAIDFIASVLPLTLRPLI